VSVGAAVDIGAYSVHLVVAEVHGHRLVPLLDESVPLGLGAVVDARGELGFEAGNRLVETLVAYVATARALGAGAIAFVATDPLRRAADAAGVIAVVEARTGVGIEVLRHEEEALLALLGVQAGRPLRYETALVDVGGGSSEVLISAPGTDPVAIGLPLGASRMTREHVHSDPPRRTEVDALLAEARTALMAAPGADPQDLVAVGGTADNLLRIGPQLARRVLTVRRMEDSIERLVAAPAETIAQQYGVKLSRARVLPAGAAILLAVAERYGRDHIRVSNDGLREGLVLAAVHAGARWRDDLAWLAHGWSL
jgi:exopolyphosphatase/guanosine-5'-triphosphate,3'-diphosphate pyrophosphatase